MAKNKVKTCVRCNATKSQSDFNRNQRKADGLMSWCRECTKSYSKDWKSRNSDHVREYNKVYNEENAERLKVLKRDYMRERKDERRLYRQKHKRRDLETAREWRKKNIEHFRKYQRGYAKQKRKENPQFRISTIFSKSIIRAVKERKNGRSWESLVGYSASDLVEHLERQFTPQMTWDNHGTYWHIDHIWPVSYFNFTSFEDEGFKKCWSLDNLQPLPAKQNYAKGSKLISYVQEI